MLVMDRATGAFRDDSFSGLARHLRPGDLLVLNDSRVIPARLYARRTLRRERKSQPAASKSCSPSPPARTSWRALVRPGRKIAIGERLVFPAPDGAIALEAEVLERGQFGERLLEFAPVDDFFARARPHRPHSAAALHPSRRRRLPIATAIRPFSPMSVDPSPRPPPACTSRRRCSKRSQPAESRSRASRSTSASARSRRCASSASTKSACTASATTITPQAAASHQRRRAQCPPHRRRRHHRGAHAGSRRSGRRQRPRFMPHSGSTDIFISPGFDFRLVGALLTNFHLPQSSLLMLVSAFAGPSARSDRILAAYRHAVRALPLLQLRRLHVHRLISAS